MNDVMVRVVDRATYKGNITSRMIEHKEHAMIYPGQRTQRLNFQFHFRREERIPEPIAKFLERKYPGLVEIVSVESICLNNDKYNIDNMKRPALLKMAARLDIDKVVTKKNEVLCEEIKRALLEGKVPIPEDEYEERKKERA